MKLKNKKGFSLVELLAVIVIVGILATLAVAGVTRYVNGARREKVNQNRKNVAMAAQLYLQANRDLLPQNIGEATRIPLSELRSTNYLKEDVTNDRGEDCMENSVVRVYKYDEKDYSYTTYLYCGKDEVPQDDVVPVPVVEKFVFSDKKNGTNTGDLNDIRNASFSFTIKGAKDDPEGNVKIYSYRYVIYVKKNSEAEYTEIFNSEYLKGGLEPSIDIKSKSLSSYVDLTGYTMFLVKVEAVNDQGGKLEWSSDAETSDGFEDNKAPVCGNIYGDDKNNNDWINKEDYASGATTSANDKRTYPGRITVECSDGAGSGCKRDQFTKTWPNNDMSDSGKVDYKFGSIWGYITIADNAVNSTGGNNTTKCYVRVNVDLKAPTVKLYAYNAKNYSATGSNTAVATATAQDTNVINGDVPSATINSDSYTNVSGVSTSEKWLNLKNYEDGLIFDAEVEDNLYLDRWTWEVNDAYIEGGTSNTNLRESVNANNASAEGGPIKGNFSTSYNNAQVTNDTELAQRDTADTKGDIKGFKLKLEGKRYGRLTVYDKAGNKTIIHVYANIDRTAPPVPNVEYVWQNDQKTAYTPALEGAAYKDNWINRKLYAYVKGQQTDAINTPKHELSGWHKFLYNYKKQNGNNSWANANDTDVVNTYSFGLGIKIDDEGTHKVQFKSCDNAGNCSKYSTLHYVKIDLTKPTCTIKKDYNGTTGPNDAGWLKKGESVLFSHVCDDPKSPYQSGCDKENKNNKETFLYDFDINTTKAGVGGDGVGGYVYDYAGNRSDECPKNETVKVDTIIPTCQASPKYNNTTGPNDKGWLKIGESVQLSISCSDAKKNGVNSGCDNNHSSNKTTHLYNEDIKTDNAGAAGDGNGGYAYDIAGNKSKECDKMKVYIDHTAPTCKTTLDYGTGPATDKGFTPGNADTIVSNGWLGMTGGSGNTRDKARVRATCTDNGDSNKMSGCNGQYQRTYIYQTEINTTTAGAGGSGNGGGKVYDVAGNASPDCPADRTVKIDYTAPTCTSSATYDTAFTGPVYNGAWTNRDVYINAVCTENGSIKSECVENKFYKYPKENNLSVNVHFSPDGFREATIFDKAGNAGSCDAYYPINIDNQKPEAKCRVTNAGGTGDPYYTRDDNNQLYVDATASVDNNKDGVNSGIARYEYNIDNGGWSASNTRALACQTSSRTVDTKVRVTDNAGNVSDEIYCGTLDIPGCCDSVTDWQDGTTCNKKCGSDGTYDRHKNSIYNDQVCQNETSGGSACNRIDCCSSTVNNGSSGCSVSCGWGTKTVYKKSAYDGSSCPNGSESCYAGECKIEASPNICGMYISYRSGSTVYFSSNGTCDISTTNQSWNGGTMVWANCNPQCLVWVQWTSGIYIWNGSAYTSTSWYTYNCGGYGYCTSYCPSVACV